MTGKGKNLLQTIALVIFILFFLFLGLIKGKSFLAPIAVAGLLAMIVVPICRWFEKHKINRGWSSFLSTLIILLFFVGLAFVLSAQVRNVAEDWPKMKSKIKPKIEKIQDFVENKTGITFQELRGSQSSGKTGSSKSGGMSFLSAQGSGQGGSGGLLARAGAFVSKFFGFLGNFLLVHIYTFFFLMYRRKFRDSVLKMATDEKKEQTRNVVGQSAKVAQNYLFGKLILILILAVLYSIGLSISNIKHAILISVLAAVLSLIPYLGNVMGYALAVTLGFISGGGLGAVIGVSITFAIAQFVESYILEPYIVGDEVDLNPIISIIVVVLGGAIWGVLGMIIAMPALGILKIIFDNIPEFQPLGYLFGDEDTGGGDSGGKVKQWVKSKFK